VRSGRLAVARQARCTDGTRAANANANAGAGQMRVQGNEVMESLVSNRFATKTRWAADGW
jgi:hypothetical protein